MIMKFRGAPTKLCSGDFVRLNFKRPFLKIAIKRRGRMLTFFGYPNTEDGSKYIIMCPIKEEQVGQIIYLMAAFCGLEMTKEKVLVKRKKHAAKKSFTGDTTGVV